MISNAINVGITVVNENCFNARTVGKMGRWKRQTMTELSFFSKDPFAFTFAWCEHALKGLHSVHKFIGHSC